MSSRVWPAVTATASSGGAVRIRLAKERRDAGVEQAAIRGASQTVGQAAEALYRQRPAAAAKPEPGQPPLQP